MISTLVVRHLKLRILLKYSHFSALTPGKFKKENGSDRTRI